MNVILRKMREKGEKRRADGKTGKGRRAIHVEDEMISLPCGLCEVPDVEYKAENGDTLMADIVMPEEKTDKKRPVIVMFYGGGLIFGCRKSNRPFRWKLAKRGYLVYSPEYRLLDQADFFGAVSDVCRGLQLVKDTLEKYGGDPDNITVIGESAGGLLALYGTAVTRSEILRKQIGCAAPDIHINALVLSSAMIYTTKTDVIAAVYKKDLYGARRKDKTFMQYANPEHPEVMGSLPKVCLTSARGDFLRNMTLNYAKALEKAGHPSLLIYYPDGKRLPHAFVSLFPSLPSSRETMKKIDTWLTSPEAPPSSSPDQKTE